MGEKEEVESKMYEFLEKYFGFKEFKSELQKNAIKCALISKLPQKKKKKRKEKDKKWKKEKTLSFNTKTFYLLLQKNVIFM